ncbi:MAG TPA: 50S ribosomal protein L27 [Candidatus Omnitrophota bacterium]|jgi:ribosomal protein L27|nr:50S ribosomal protein L27 [Candidatus Omnitrophota bacterium]HPN56979.1 50S ribosomal protein L27 [Candidatus Omnitrophota bacterium]
MAKKGGLTSKFYRETRGIKVAGGQFVRAGTVLTREGDKWKPGLNVTGEMHLNAICDGKIYFSRKRNKYNKQVTYVNVQPVAANGPEKA